MTQHISDTERLEQLALPQRKAHQRDDVRQEPLGGGTSDSVLLQPLVGPPEPLGVDVVGGLLECLGKLLDGFKGEPPLPIRLVVENLEREQLVLVGLDESSEVRHQRLCLVEVITRIGDFVLAHGVDYLLAARVEFVEEVPQAGLAEGLRRRYRQCLPGLAELLLRGRTLPEELYRLSNLPVSIYGVQEAVCELLEARPARLQHPLGVLGGELLLEPCQASCERCEGIGVPFAEGYAFEELVEGDAPLAL